MLTSTPIPFAYVDKATSLTACQPLIALNPRGRIACVRLNNRSMQPLRLPSAETEAVYAAYRAWTAIVARPEFALGLRLAPGDCLVFDNTRILHARTAFAAAPPVSPTPRLPDSAAPDLGASSTWPSSAVNVISRAATPTSTASCPPAPSSAAPNRPPPSDNSKKRSGRRQRSWRLLSCRKKARHRVQTFHIFWPESDKSR